MELTDFFVRQRIERLKDIKENFIQLTKLINEGEDIRDIEIRIPQSHSLEYNEDMMFDDVLEGDGWIFTPRLRKLILEEINLQIKEYMEY